MIYATAVFCFFLGYCACWFCAKGKIDEMEMLCGQWEACSQHFEEEYDRIAADRQRYEDLRRPYQMSLPATAEHKRGNIRRVK